MNCFKIENMINEQLFNLYHQNIDELNDFYADLDSKVDHVSSDWIIDKEATLESDGSKHKECTVCKEVLETEKIAKLENKATVTPTVKKEEIKTETKTATQAVKTGDNTNIIEVVCLLVFSLVVLTFVRKYC